MNMIPKDCKKMTNNEIRLYKMNLENEYEATKAKISELEKLLDELDVEYIKAENEEKIRRTAF